MLNVTLLEVAEMFRANRPCTGEDQTWANRHSDTEIARESGRQDGARFQWETAVEDFASLVGPRTPAFDRHTFFRACGHSA